MNCLDNSDIRRRDRLLNEDDAAKLLKEGEYGFLSMVERENSAYGVPISYVWDGAEHIFMHCATTGHKLDCLKICPDVSFCVVGPTRILPVKFTTAYTSVLVRGRICCNLNDEEKTAAMQLLLEKYAPEEMDRGLKYVADILQRVEVLRLDILKISGKQRTEN